MSKLIKHPAELEVDPLAGRLGRHQDLGLLLELPLGVDAGARRVAVADLHPAVDLRDRQPPLAELAQRAGCPCRRPPGSRACPCAR